MRRRNSSTRTPGLPGSRIAASLAGSACPTAAPQKQAPANSRAAREPRSIPTATAAPRGFAVGTRRALARGVKLARGAALEPVVLSGHGPIGQVLSAILRHD